jgi:hypothetical protein
VSVLRAIWPVTDDTIPTADLIAEARADLPAVARRHGLVITGDTAHCAVRIAKGRGVPGSGGARRVLIAEVPAETIRDHHRSTAA